MSSISIVIVNFNSGAFLEAAIDSLRRLTPSSELIVIDNASSDSSVDFLKPHRGLIFVKLDENYGFGAASNIGAAKATNDLILFLNPDAFLPEGTLRKMTEYLAAHPESGLCGALLLDLQGREQAGSRRYDPTLLRSCGKVARSISPFPILPTFDRHDEALPETSVHVDAISGACMMVRRQVHEQIGGFDEGYFLHFEDLDYCRRAREQGWNIGFVPDAPVFHYQGGSGVTTEISLLRHKEQGLRRYLDKFGAQGALPHAIRSFILSLLVVIGRLLVSAASNRRKQHPWQPSRRIDSSAIKIGQTLTGQEPAVLVFGARSDVGDAVNARLNARGLRTVSVTRHPDAVRTSPLASTIHPEMVVRNYIGAGLNAVAVVSLCPIWELSVYEKFLGSFLGNRTPWIVLSSTSAVTKMESNGERAPGIASRLRQGEEWLARFRSGASQATIVLRPTLIYGGVRNRNINKIKAIARYSRIRLDLEFAEGRRQPIHCDDIAEWTTALLSRALAESGKARPANTKSPVTLVELSGGETVSFVEMVNRTQAAACVGGVKLLCSRRSVRFLFSLVNWVPWFNEVPKDFVSRLEKDFLFSNNKALALQPQSLRRFYP